MNDSWASKNQAAVAAAEAEGIAQHVIDSLLNRLAENEIRPLRIRAVQVQAGRLVVIVEYQQTEHGLDDPGSSQGMTGPALGRRGGRRPGKDSADLRWPRPGRSAVWPVP